MDNPFRLSENESVILDSRLSTLESKASIAIAWRRLAVVGFVVMIAFQALFFAKLHHSESSEGCIDEVKMGRVLRFQHPDSSDIIETITLKCDNPRQRSRILSHNEETVTLQCVCQ